MEDLDIYSIPLEKIKLERMDVWNKKHVKALKGLRDATAKKMCYDVKSKIRDAKKEGLSGNDFLVRNNENDNYFGYVHISNEHNGVRTLSYIVSKKLRGQGIGKIILTGVSDYLLENGLATTVSLCVKKENLVGMRLVESCGFEKRESVFDIVDLYSRRK